MIKMINVSNKKQKFPKIVGRNKEVDFIVNNWLDNKGVCLIGSRKIGKTTILKKSVDKISKNNSFLPIYISVHDLKSMDYEEFILTLHKIILKSVDKILKFNFNELNSLKFSEIDVIKEVKSNNIDIKDEFRYIKSIEENLSLYEINLSKSFRLIDNICNNLDKKYILIVDDIGDLSNLYLGSKFVGNLIYQEISKLSKKHNNNLIVSISDIKTKLNDLVLEKKSIFSKKFELLFVEGLKTNDIKNITNQTTDFVKQLYELTKGNPFYVNFIYMTYLIKKDFIKSNDVQDYFDDFIQNYGDTYFSIIYRNELANNQKIVMYAISQGKYRLSEISDYTNIKTNVLSKVTLYLEHKGFIYKESKGIYKIQDNVFEEWIKLKFK